ncbi:MAG: hypothetical protein GX558_02600, partial [Clostridiales bacterium]|nr:hypothetical protein [Clostridiales bacterium]
MAICSPAKPRSPARRQTAGGVLGGLLDRFEGRTQPPDAAATPEPSRPSALFDDGVRQITGAVWGGAVDYAYVGGWTVSRGYFDGRYCITGIPPSGGAREALTDSGPPTFVSTGDAIVYYGEATKGDYAWLSLVPGERVPLKLPLDASAEVFYADGEYIWYYTYGKGESATIGRMAHDGSKKNK